MTSSLDVIKNRRNKERDKKENIMHDEYIINSLDDIRLMAAIEEILNDSVTCWSKWDNIEIKVLKDCIITKSPIDIPFFIV